ncbi:MAG: O-antigen ligase family protein, partial [Thermomicrobiales bacterium]|nr:O-antigen ligase family protein [Thermomicrobiales bacterium]
KLALGCVVVAWSINIVTGRVRLNVTPVAWALGTFCLALTASVVHARDVASWAAEVYRWGAAALVYLIAASSTRRPFDRRIVLVALGAGIVFSLGVALYQVSTGTGPETFTKRGYLRAYGLFGEPNPFAGYLEMASLPLLAFGCVWLRRPRRDVGWWSGVAAAAVGLLGVATLALTQSRGGLLGLGAGIAVIVWMLYPRGGRLIVVLGAFAAMVMLFTPPAAGVRSTFGLDVLLGDGPRQVSPANFATEERLTHWGAAWRMWRSEPWLGIGAGNVPERFREYTPEWRFRISRGHAHSAYLQAAAQAGIAGFGAYLVLLGTAWGRCRRHVTRDATNELRAMSVAALAVTAAIAVHGMVEYLHVLSLGLVLSAVWALPESEREPRVNGWSMHGPY